MCVYFSFCWGTDLPQRPALLKRLPQIVEPDRSDLVRARLERCDFKKEAAATNLTCSAKRSAGSVEVPIRDMNCRPLQLKKKD